MLAKVKSLLPAGLRRAIRQQFVSYSATHVSGPKRLRLARNEAVVTCVVKNGEFYIESFIRHYLRMGFRHIFFLDNGSTDNTIAIAQQHPNVSICASSLPIEAYQRVFKSYLAQTSTQGGWCLDADIDEFFDYPGSDAVGLRDFLDYLNQRQATAVITQLLDMFSHRPLSELSREGNDLTSVYQYYDLSDVTRTEYRGAVMVARYGARNEVTNAQAALYFGGIRKTLYGNNCLLTKHSLFVPGSGVELFPHVHFMNRARLADVSCLMLHYKLTSTALESAVQNKEGFVGNSQGYLNFINFLTNHPDQALKNETAVRFRRADDLVESGFLFMSEKYRQYLRSKSKSAATEADSASASGVQLNAGR
jgi:glycosyltransferase involved in cell wall biosynthesis